MNRNKEMTAREYVETLLKDGDKASCDEFNESFRNCNELPPYYNEKLFKRGQSFFFKHFYAFGIAPTIGLVVAYAIPSLLNVLKTTNRNNSALKLYKRQTMTFMLLDVLYRSDLQPGSKSWKVISKIKNMHNSASKRSAKIGFNPIKQKDMALTQFVFIGFALTRAELVGIHNATVEELKGHLHFWRVIGYLIGIEERFNICSFPIEKTRQICEILITEYLRPLVEEKDPDFLKYSTFLCKGVSATMPELVPKCVLTHAYNLVQNKGEIPRTNYIEMNIFLRLYYRCFVFVMVYLMSWSWFRILKNFILMLNAWLIGNFPLILFFKFGTTDTHVNVNI